MSYFFIHCQSAADADSTVEVDSGEDLSMQDIEAPSRVAMVELPLEVNRW
jgi:hypothetical protein